MTYNNDYMIINLIFNINQTIQFKTIIAPVQYYDMVSRRMTLNM